MSEETQVVSPPLRPIAEIIKDLSKEIADRHLKSKALKGRKITFMPWYYAVKYLDLYASGWSGELRSVSEIGGRCVVVYRISIPCEEGVVWREATGQESDWDEDEETKYGDPSSNAEAMAFKRAAAKFGLGLYLYDGGGGAKQNMQTRPTPAQQPTPQQAALNAQAPLPSTNQGWQISEGLRSTLADQWSKLEELGIPGDQIVARLERVAGVSKLQALNPAGAAKINRSFGEWIAELRAKQQRSAA